MGVDGWNAFGERDDLVFVESPTNPPPTKWIDGWVTIVRNGIAHVTYYEMTPSGKALVVDRHIMRGAIIHKNRPATDAALAEDRRSLDS